MTVQLVSFLVTVAVILIGWAFSAGKLHAKVGHLEEKVEAEAGAREESEEEATSFAQRTLGRVEVTEQSQRLIGTDVVRMQEQLKAFLSEAERRGQEAREGRKEQDARLQRIEDGIKDLSVKIAEGKKGQ